jgi:hypothetical protein
MVQDKKENRSTRQPKEPEKTRIIIIIVQHKKENRSTRQQKEPEKPRRSIIIVQDKKENRSTRQPEEPDKKDEKKYSYRSRGLERRKEEREANKGQKTRKRKLTLGESW